MKFKVLMRLIQRDLKTKNWTCDWKVIQFFWVTFQVILCFYYFCNFRKEGPRPKLTIYKHVSDKNKKCLSVGNFWILYQSSSVARLQPTLAYLEVWKFTKIKVVQFLRLFFWAGQKYWPMSEKNMTKMSGIWVW